MKPNQFDELGVELDAESWEYLTENYPRIADALELHVSRGATPDQLRAFVIRRVGVNREDLAQRVENAARYLESVNK